MASRPFRNHFLKPLEQALSDEAFSKQSHQSPIIDYPQDVTRAQEYLPKADSRDYYILSFFIQKYSLLNQYQEHFPFSSCSRSTARPITRRTSKVWNQSDLYSAAGNEGHPERRAQGVLTRLLSPLPRRAGESVVVRNARIFEIVSLILRG